MSRGTVFRDAIILQLIKASLIITFLLAAYLSWQLTQDLPNVYTPL
jgi:hypothetical protein